MADDEPQQRRDPIIRTLALLADANQSGDIFGGWLLSQMDIASGITAHERARGRVATVAIEAMEFHLPVFVGDLISCYTEITRVGTTSITIHVVTEARRRDGGETIKVTEGTFIFVALDGEGRPRPVDG
ncbi:MAG: acyl-CoA thioesterase [Alphaproteobacteria bacterium]|jgi:acyl-CoA thioesterase YciA